MAPVRWRWFHVAAACASGLLLVALVQYGYIEGDTRSLLNDTDGLLACLHRAKAIPCPEAGKFAPFQLLLALPLRSLGASHEQIGIWLARLSTAAFLGLLALAWRAVRGTSEPLAWATLLGLGTGELLHYSTHSFVEMPQAFLIMLFVTSWMGDRPLLAAVGVGLAALCKESSPPFLAAVGVLCFVAKGTPWRAQRTLLAAAAGGLALGALLNAGFDAFRFAAPYNVSYLAESRLAPGLGAHVQLFASLWVAPNGGWLFFWPAFVVAFAAVAWRPPGRGWRLAAAALTLTLASLTWFLSGWWSPFGWWAWGQRLMLPWLPAIGVLGLLLFARPLEEGVRRLTSSRGRTLALAATAIALALPHVASVFRGNALIETQFAGPTGCATPVAGADGPYYRCILARAWEPPFALVDGYREVAHPFVRGRALLYGFLLVYGVARLRRANASGTV